jgi:hypothetical protein
LRSPRFPIATAWDRSPSHRSFAFSSMPVSSIANLFSCWYLDPLRTSKRSERRRCHTVRPWTGFRDRDSLSGVQSQRNQVDRNRSTISFIRHSEWIPS